jgi:hypothetical protein
MFEHNSDGQKKVRPIFKKAWIDVFFAFSGHRK